MKESDYIVTLAPMRTVLKLKGQACDLFAIIYGYSKDGESTCRASLTYLAEWLGTDRHAVSKLIKRLEKAGYINKIEYLRGDMKCYEYTSNYGAMLAKAARGEEMGLPTAKSVVKNTTVVKSTQKCCNNNHESVVKITTNNTIENNIDYYSFRTCDAQEQEEEKKSFYRIFFFRNAANPTEEVERFIAYNESRGWTSDAGRVYDTPEKRRGLATIWEFRKGDDRCAPEFIKSLQSLYNQAVEAGIDGADDLLDQRMSFRFDGKACRWILTVGKDSRAWLERNKELSLLFIRPITKGWPVKFNNA